MLQSLSRALKEEVVTHHQRRPGDIPDPDVFDAPEMEIVLHASARSLRCHGCTLVPDAVYRGAGASGVARGR
jgi:hypothetical protein